MPAGLGGADAAYQQACADREGAFRLYRASRRGVAGQYDAPRPRGAIGNGRSRRPLRDPELAAAATGEYPGHPEGRSCRYGHPRGSATAPSCWRSCTRNRTFRVHGRAARYGECGIADMPKARDAAAKISAAGAAASMIAAPTWRSTSCSPQFQATTHCGGARVAQMLSTSARRRPQGLRAPWQPMSGAPTRGTCSTASSAARLHPDQSTAHPAAWPALWRDQRRRHARARRHHHGAVREPVPPVESSSSSMHYGSTSTSATIPARSSATAIARQSSSSPPIRPAAACRSRRQPAAVRRDPRRRLFLPAEPDGAAHDRHGHDRPDLTPRVYGRPG